MELCPRLGMTAALLGKMLDEATTGGPTGAVGDAAALRSGADVGRKDTITVTSNPITDAIEASKPQKARCRGLSTRSRRPTADTLRITPLCVPYSL